MRKVFSKLALAAAALAGASTSANAFVILTLQDTGPGLLGAVTCDTSAAVTAVNCGAGFTIITPDNVSFNGTVGDFTVSNTSGTNNFPGAVDEAFVAASTTNVVNNRAAGSGTDNFYINVRSFGFLLPAGEEKTFFGSASQTSTKSEAGDSVLSRFSVDPNNAGALVNLLSCNLTIIANSSCNTGAPIVWQDPAMSAPGFSIRDEQFFTLNGGSRTGTTSTATVGAIPEPMTTSLVGVALLGMALASRRRSTKA